MLWPSHSDRQISQASPYSCYEWGYHPQKHNQPQPPISNIVARIYAQSYRAKFVDTDRSLPRVSYKTIVLVQLIRFDTKLRSSSESSSNSSKSISSSCIPQRETSEKCSYHQDSFSLCGSASGSFIGPCPQFQLCGEGIRARRESGEEILLLVSLPTPMFRTKGKRSPALIGSPVEVSTDETKSTKSPPTNRWEYS